MLVPVWGGSANFLLTVRGRVRDMVHSCPLLFLFVGVIGYLSGSTQGTLEAFRSLQEHCCRRQPAGLWNVWRMCFGAATAPLHSAFARALEAVA
jgi:hypothetical protein